MNKILWCYHSNETSSAVLSHGTIYLVCSSIFESVDEILWCYISSETSSAVLSHNNNLFLQCEVLTFECVVTDILHTAKLHLYH